VPEQTRSVVGVPAWNVLKGDQRVIGLWNSDGIGLEGSDLRSIRLQVAPESAPAVRRKAIGGWIDLTQLVRLTASQGSPEPRRRGAEKPPPPPPV
jgi:hypothetical protein